MHRPHHVNVVFNHVNRMEHQSLRAGGFKLRKKVTQAWLFNYVEIWNWWAIDIFNIPTKC
jgi:hypothetical protein